MRKRLYLRGPHVAVDVHAFRLFGKHHGHAEVLGRHTGDADAGGLDSEYLVDGRACEQALPLRTHGAEQGDVHLMVQKGVHLQNAARLYHTLFSNALFQQLHALHPFPAAGRTVRPA